MSGAAQLPGGGAHRLHPHLPQSGHRPGTLPYQVSNSLMDEKQRIRETLPLKSYRNVRVMLLEKSTVNQLTILCNMLCTSTQRYN